MDNLVQIQLAPPKPKVDPAELPHVTSELSFNDRFGAFKVRLGAGRMAYTVPPGLYALGSPDKDSDVLVSANYKLSFDALRSALSGYSFWILVLDTKGINVWCAAGKGTFGTDELSWRIRVTGLDQLVTHRRVIVPQLGAPGVAAHEVKRRTGFKVVYGPIEATDIPAFISAGNRATPAMRRKTFSLRERVVLIPIELRAAFRWWVLLSVLFSLIAGITGVGGFVQNALTSGVPVVAAILGGILAGAILTPIFLPVLPGRAFSLKSIFPAGAVIALLLYLVGNGFAQSWSRLESASLALMIIAIAAYLAMNFTGASTYTSLSGVKKEMRLWVPIEIGAGAVGVLLWIASRVVLRTGGAA